MTAGSDDDEDGLEVMEPDDEITAYLETRKRAVRLSSWKTDLTALRHLRSYLDLTDNEPSELTQSEAEQMLYWLKDKDIKDASAEGYAHLINQFYTYCSRRNEEYAAIDRNPVEIPYEDVPFDDDRSTERRDICLEEMRSAIRSINHPQLLAIILLLIKTAIRNAELCNLDLRDVNIDHPRIDEIHPGHRPKLDGRPDTIYVPSKSEIRAGEEYHGELRGSGNKRHRATYIPIDNELKHALLLWLLIRPESRSPADPLLTITVGGKGTRPGDRFRSDTLTEYVTNWAAKQGWWQSDATLETNVTPHYFRHYFTTQMRASGADEMMIKYIRGDKGDDIMDRYTHSWGDLVRRQYLDYIYSVL